MWIFQCKLLTFLNILKWSWSPNISVAKWACVFKGEQQYTQRGQILSCRIELSLSRLKEHVYGWCICRTLPICATSVCFMGEWLGKKCPKSPSKAEKRLWRTSRLGKAHHVLFVKVFRMEMTKRSDLRNFLESDCCSYNGFLQRTTYLCHQDLKSLSETDR